VRYATEMRQLLTNFAVKGMSKVEKNLASNELVFLHQLDFLN
jgi:hypothetical protein